jgi:hypothetical protein
VLGSITAAGVAGDDVLTRHHDFHAAVEISGDGAMLGSIPVAHAHLLLLAQAVDPCGTLGIPLGLHGSLLLGLLVLYSPPLLVGRDFL